jgi:hypothetical protein
MNQQDTQRLAEKIRKAVKTTRLGFWPFCVFFGRPGSENSSRRTEILTYRSPPIAHLVGEDDSGAYWRLVGRARSRISCASLWPIFPAIFTTDYADSADISLIAEHP